MKGLHGKLLVQHSFTFSVAWYTRRTSVQSAIVLICLTENLSEFVLGIHYLNSRHISFHWVCWHILFHWSFPGTACSNPFPAPWNFMPFLKQIPKDHFTVGSAFSSVEVGKWRQNLMEMSEGGWKIGRLSVVEMPLLSFTVVKTVVDC